MGSEIVANSDYAALGYSWLMSQGSRALFREGGDQEAVAYRFIDSDGLVFHRGGRRTASRARRTPLTICLNAAGFPL